jgi:organic hydroperoxide reductase OsmC/OhrA
LLTDRTSRTYPPLPLGASNGITTSTVPRARHSRRVTLDQFGPGAVASERLLNLGRTVTELATLQLAAEGSALSTTREQHPAAIDQATDDDALHPGQFLAAGLAVCFLGALLGTAAKAGCQVPPNVSVDASVDVGTGPVGVPTVRLLLHVALPGLNAWAAQDMLTQAHSVCPYTHVSRDAVDVVLRAA